MTLTFPEAVKIAMEELARDNRVIFLGQNVQYPGHSIYDSLKDIPGDRKLEFPVAEDMQLGISTGLSLAGFLPVTCYPRIDFLLLAMNQLVLHLDKLEEMSQGQFRPQVIVRTMLGADYPLDPGPQHSGDYIEGLRRLLRHIPVFPVSCPEQVRGAYRFAHSCGVSTIVVEIDKDKRREYRS